MDVLELIGLDDHEERNRYGFDRTKGTELLRLAMLGRR